MTTTWFEATPELLLILGVLVAPGLLVARCLTFGWWDAVGLSVPLSLGVLAIADEGAAKSGVRWGLPAIVATAVFLAVLSWVFARFVLKHTPEGDIQAAPSYDGRRWSQRGHVIAGLVTLAAAVLGGIAVARGIGTPHAITQTWDSTFHVNSIHAVVQQHSGAPSVVSGVTGPGSNGFYPPLFAAIAALSSIYGGVNAIVAANVASVAIAVLWPLTMTIALRRIARPGVFGYSVAMWGTVSVALFPALLLQFGTVWPNALSALCLAPGLVLMLRILGLDRGARGEDPHGSLAWGASVAALLLMLPGIGFAQPATAFALFYLGAPMLIWFLWRRFIARDADPARKALVGTAVVLGVGILSVGVILASYRIASIRSVGHFYWKPKGSELAAVRRVFELHSLQTDANLAFGILALVGICVGLAYARGRFLAMGYLIIGTLYVFAFAIQSRLTMHLTGYWYNDNFRLIGMLPVIALPLAALGADALVDFAKLGWRKVSGESDASSRRAMTAAIVAGAIICAAVVAIQGGLGLNNATRTVALAYANSPQTLVTPGEVAMFQRLHHEVPQGTTVAGNPFDGEILVGVISGRPSIYNDFHASKDPDRVLVARDFANYRQDPAVCAAVRRLRIGVVVQGPPFGRGHFVREPLGHQRAFVGFADLSSVPGLRVIDQGGGATAYELPLAADGLAACSS